MRTKSLFLMATLVLALAAPTLAGSRPPVIPLANVTPHVAVPGEILTFGAYVVAPEGRNVDPFHVGLFFDTGTGPEGWIFLRLMVLDEVFGIYRARIELPEDIPEGRYNFAVLAFSEEAGVSEPYFLHVLVVPPDAPIPDLISPEMGEVFGDWPPTLAWTLVEHATAYEVELSWGHEASSFVVPALFNVLPVNDLVWQFMPDGRYLWRVRAIRGEHHGPWSELGVFFKATDGADTTDGGS